MTASAQWGSALGLLLPEWPRSLIFKPLEAVILRVDEPNSARDLSDLVNYVYRENADISIPYTIYAAATAGIPVITSDDSLLAEIVLREGIGLTIGMLSSEYEIKYDFDGFWGAIDGAV